MQSKLTFFERVGTPTLSLMFGYFYGENMAKDDISRRVTEMLMPFLEENGLDIYKVEYKKEGPAWVLRVSLDKPVDAESEYVSIDDCEKVNVWLSGMLDENDIIELSINKDSDAEQGDVRDIVIKRGEIQWEIGLSMKHNHFAAKHSRLSPSIDFGKKWYGTPCDQSYWKNVKPIFDNLKELKKNRVAWHDMNDKENSVYVPLLTAFKEEMLRAYQQSPEITKKLISYLLGIKDFYKVVSVDRKHLTEFQSFNLRGELNKDGKNHKATIFIPIAQLPDEIISLRFKPQSQTTLELYLNNGWSLSFRIHNASTIIEPSLKFDIQFIGVPKDIITINCTWN